MSELGKLERLLGAVEVEFDADTNGFKNFQTNFCMGILGYDFEPDSFTRLTKQMEKKGHSPKLMRLVQKTFDYLHERVCEIYLDITHYGVTFEQSLKDVCDIYGEEPEAITIAFNYAASVIDFQKLNIADNLYTKDDLSEELLMRRIEGGELIETNSKLGKEIERLLSRLKMPQYNKSLREAFCKFAVGIEYVDKRDFSLAIKPVRSKIPENNYNKILDIMDTHNVFEMFNIVHLFKQDPELVCEAVGKCSMADYEYVTKILGSDFESKDFLFSDEVSPLDDEVLKTAKESIDIAKFARAEAEREEEARKKEVLEANTKA